MANKKRNMPEKIHSTIFRNSILHCLWFTTFAVKSLKWTGMKRKKVFFLDSVEQKHYKKSIIDDKHHKRLWSFTHTSMCEEIKTQDCYYCQILSGQVECCQMRSHLARLHLSKCFGHPGIWTSKTFCIFMV